MNIRVFYYLKYDWFDSFGLPERNPIKEWLNEIQYQNLLYVVIVEDCQKGKDVAKSIPIALQWHKTQWNKSASHGFVILIITDLLQTYFNL